MKVLVACEESQTVCKAFRQRGHEAYSCDLVLPTGENWEWHIQGDAVDVMNSQHWDLMIAHPPCTYLSNAAARWLYKGGVLNEDRYKKGLKAKELFMAFYNSNIRYVAIENPQPSLIYQLPKPSQAIQPFEYGEPYSKRTLLWLKNLPQLKPTNVLTEYSVWLPSNTGGQKRGQVARFVYRTKQQRSKTFEGIAAAMAEQWGSIEILKPEIV